MAIRDDFLKRYRVVQNGMSAYQLIVQTRSLLICTLFLSLMKMRNLTPLGYCLIRGRSLLL